MRVSIVVPTFNRRQIVRRTLGTLFNQEFPREDYEIIVVVDGSTDGTANLLRGLRGFPELRVVEQENRGPAGARNTGLRAARGDIVIFLDDDMLCDPGLIRAHASAHNTADGLLALGAIFLSADSPRTLASDCFQREAGPFYTRQRHDPNFEWPEGGWVFGNSSVRRRRLLDEGGFDERFRMREDADLGLRLVQAGVRVRYIPEAIGYQFYAKNARDLLRDAEGYARADLLFVSKHPHYRPRTEFARLEGRAFWKRLLSAVVIRIPVFPDLLLAAMCSPLEHLRDLPMFRRAGVRLLQFRRSIAWQRAVLAYQRDQEKPAWSPGANSSTRRWRRPFSKRWPWRSLW